jgi:O-antigen/teichoic acid export membrane protein
VLEVGLTGILWSSVLTNLFLFGVYTWGVLRDIRPTFSVPDAKDLLAYGLPLVPGSVAYFLITFGDNFFLNEFRTPAEIGIYGLAYKFGILVSYAVTKPFMEFWRIRVYELYARGRVRLKQRRAVNYYSFCVIQVALLISLLIDEVIRVTKSTFWDAASIVPLLALGYVFAGLRLVFELGIHMKKQTKYSSYVTVASLVVNVSMNLLLIPRYGIHGAAVATLVTFVFMAVLALWFSERIFPIHYNVHRIVQLLLVAGGLYALSHFTGIRGWYKSVVKDLLIGFSFPLVLLLVGFYRKEERRIAGQAVRGILAWLRRKTPRSTRFEAR